MSSFKAFAINPRTAGALARTLFATGFSLAISALSTQAYAECQYVIANQWNNGFTATIKITNSRTSAINGWSVNWQYAGDNRITNSWNATLGGTNPYTATNLSWNRTIQPNESVEFGVQGTKGAAAAEIPILTGAGCAMTAPPSRSSLSNSSAARSSLGGNSSSPAIGGAGVTFHQHNDYGGYGVTLGIGNYSLSQLASQGIQNDDISSLKVPSGWQVVMYEHDNYVGASLTKTSDDSTLADDNWNERISSVKITRRTNSSSPSQTSSRNSSSSTPSTTTSKSSVAPSSKAASSIAASSRASSSAATTAVWLLDSTTSYLNFVTTKNTHNLEAHNFTGLEGDISSAGVATLKIDLNSVNTGIALRDQRMKELLFKTVTYPTATVTLTVPTGAISSLTVGKDQVIEIAANLDLHGVTSAITTKVALQKLSATRILIQNLTPVLVKASDHSLTEGIEALRAAVGIASISTAVPVDFTLVFDAR